MKKKRPLTQCEEILIWIHKHGSITRATAANLHIFELSARIGELEKKGYQFDRKRLSGKTAFGRPWKCVEYSNPRKVA